MKTQVEFRSSKFPPYEGEEEEITPGLWGNRLAEYLVQKLAQPGIKIEEIIGEDWGVVLRSATCPLGRDSGALTGFRLNSGKDVAEHPETQRVLSDIKRGHITGPISSKLARLARNTRGLP